MCRTVMIAVQAPPLAGQIVENEFASILSAFVIIDSDAANASNLRGWSTAVVCVIQYQRCFQLAILSLNYFDEVRRSSYAVWMLDEREIRFISRNFIPSDDFSFGNGFHSVVRFESLAMPFEMFARLPFSPPSSCR